VTDRRNSYVTCKDFRLSKSRDRRRAMSSTLDLGLCKPPLQGPLKCSQRQRLWVDSRAEFRPVSFAAH
jgi:hypothetical protein